MTAQTDFFTNERPIVTKRVCNGDNQERMICDLITHQGHLHISLLYPANPEFSVLRFYELILHMMAQKRIDYHKRQIS